MKNIFFNHLKEKRTVWPGKVVLIFLFFLFTISATAQLPPETNWGEYPHVVGYLNNPGYRETVYDSVFKVNVTRITDEEAFGESGGAIQHQYSKVQAWNSDMSIISVGFTTLIDASDYSLIGTLNIGESMKDGRWSNVDPEIRYFGSGEYLKKVNVLTKEVTVLHKFPGFGTCTIGPWEGNISADDHYVAVTSWDEKNAALYDIENDTILGTGYFEGTADWVSVTPWGDYVVVSNRTSGHTELYDMSFNYLRDISDVQSHADFAIDSEGNRVFVQMCPLRMVNIETGEETDLLPETEYTQGTCGTPSSNHDNPWVCGHVSGRNFAMPGWVLISAGIDKCNNGYDAYYNRTEIFHLKLDGSGTIRHYGFTRSTIKNYLAQPKATISPDGKKAIFTSDWNLDGYGTGDARDYEVEFNTGKTFSLSTGVSSGEGTISPSGGTYSEGSNVSIEATPSLGFQFDSWGVDLSGSDNPSAIVMDTNKHVTAAFSEIATYTLQTATVGNGIISLSPEGGIYNEGTVVSLTPIPAAGFKFDSWSGDLSGSDNPATLSMDGNKTVTATFVEQNSLLAYWQLNETSGTNLADASGNGQDATLNNSDESTFVEGIVSGAVFFNGNRDAQISSAPALAPKSVTIAAYVKVDPSNSDWAWIAAHGDNYGLYVSTDGWLEFYYYDGSDWPFALGNIDIRDNKWHHVAGTFNNVSKTIKLYVDGVLDNQSAGTGSIKYSIGNDFHIGSMQGSRNFKGTIDELRVYDRALSQSEIDNLLISGTQYTLTTNAINGNVSVTPLKETYNENSVVTLKAIPDDDYEFESWDGDLTGTLNPAELTMDADKAVQAKFHVASSVNNRKGINPNLKVSPNPVTNSAQISYTVHTKTNVQLSVFNLHGKQVKTLVNRVHQPGNFNVEWNGSGLTAGVYLCRFQNEGQTRNVKMLLIN